MAMLATMIMEGVSAGSSEGLYGKYDFSKTAISESSYMASACASLFSDIMEADQAFMVSDIVGAATVIRESAAGNSVNQVAVYEGILKSGIEKLKGAFQKFIAKVKEYYKRVIDWFKAMFADAETFAKKFGDMLKKKAAKVKDFHYSGFKYTIEKGISKSDAFAKAVQDNMNSLLEGFDIAKECKTKEEFHQHLRDKVLKTDFKDDDGKPTASEEVDTFIGKNSSASDISDLRTELIEEYQDGDSNKSDIKDFEANSIDSMLKFLTDSNNKTSKWETQLKAYEDKVNKVIQKLNSFEKKDGEANGDNLVSHASYLSGLMTAFLNLYKVPCEVKISIHKTIAKEWLGVLKKFYNFKGNAVKESADAEDYADIEESLITMESDDSGDGEDGGKKGGEGDEPATESALQGILEAAAQYGL